MPELRPAGGGPSRGRSALRHARGQLDL